MIEGLLIGSALVLCTLLLILPGAISIALVLAFLGWVVPNEGVSIGLYLLSAGCFGIYLMRFRK